VKVNNQTQLKRNQHHHLILQPDDIWLAMLLQFSKHVEQNVAKPRDSIVNFDKNDAGNEVICSPDVTDGKKS
jgi:hypothetical protein